MQKELELALTNKYHALSKAQQLEFISKLSPQDYLEFRYYSNCFLRPEQQIPDGDWLYYLLQCGRFWGKSLAGAHWLVSKVYQRQQGLAVVAPTHRDIEDYIREAINAEFPDNKKPKYIAGDKQRFECFNGITIKAYSSDKEIRGANLSYIWCDEFCAWNDRNEEKATERFEVMDAAVRKAGAQILITTTPRPWKIMREWNKAFRSGDPTVQVIYGESADNLYINQQKKNKLYAKYDGTRLGEQELHGYVLEDIEGALFKQAWIDQTRLTEEQYLTETRAGRLHIVRIIIAVDPAITSNESSCETGIIVVGLSSNDQVYVLADLSGTYTPAEWATVAIKAFDKYDASLIVAEANQGGDLVRANIHSLDSLAPVSLVKASKGKIIRAEPVASVYEQGKIHHVGRHADLEHQLTHFTGSKSSSNSDRLDALVWGISQLRINRTYFLRDLSSIAAQ